MRVWHVHVSRRLGPVNGVVQAIHQLAEAQRALGCDVEVLHGTGDDPRRRAASGTAAGLAAEWRERRAAPPDVVHLHELFRPPHLAVAPLLRTVPYVVSTHGATEPANLARYRGRKAAYARLVERRVLRRARALVALTPTERDHVRAWLAGSPPVHVVANVADPALLAASPWAPAEGPPAPTGRPDTLVCLARYDVRHKGLDRLAGLAAWLPDAGVVVHGAPCGNEPERLAALRAASPASFRFAPPVTGAGKERALREAAGFVLLSRWEGLSMALLEALALGVPCFVSPEVAATLGDRPPVVVVPDEPAAAADLVGRLLADPARRAAVGRAGRSWAERHASPGTVAARMLEVYRAAAGGPGRAAAPTGPGRSR